MKDVCIIGGGIVGLCCAYELHREGFDVTIIDRGDFSDGCSFGNAGMLVPSHFIPLASPGIMAKGIQWMFQKKSPFYIRPRLDLDLIRWLYLFDRSASKQHVIAAAPLLRDMHVQSRDFYKQLQQQLGFDFGLEEKGILMLYQTQDTEHEEGETADMAYTLGIDVQKLSHTELQKLEEGTQIDVRGGYHYAGDAHLQPDVLMQQLMADLKQKGVHFLFNHEVINVSEETGRAVKIEFKTKPAISSKKLVIAGGVWTSHLLKPNKIKLPLQDGKGYSITVHNLHNKPQIPSILIDDRVAITPMGPHLRISGTLEISGMDNKIRQTKVNAIREAVTHYYPTVRIPADSKPWFGYRPCTPDGMPYIGPLKSGSSIYVAAGHAMMGLSLAPATAQMITNVIKHPSQNHHQQLLRPLRFSK